VECVFYVCVCDWNLLLLLLVAVQFAMLARVRRLPVLYGRSALRWLAKVAKKPESEAPPKQPSLLPFDHLQVYKEGEAPAAKPDSEYPPWLWQIDVPLPTLAELAEANASKLTLAQKRRLASLQRKARMREHNQRMSKDAL